MSYKAPGPGDSSRHFLQKCKMSRLFYQDAAQATEYKLRDPSSVRHPLDNNQTTSDNSDNVFRLDLEYK